MLTITYFVNNILNLEISPISDPLSGVNNGKELIRAKAMARKLEAEVTDQLLEDGRRFQALMRCPRIKMQGSAGVDPKTGERKYPDLPGSVHFGAEFWPTPARDFATKEPVVYSDCTPERSHWGHHALRALADDILAVEAAAGQQFNPDLPREDWNVKTIKLEGDEIAHFLGSFLPSKYNWQHIREASKAFVNKLTELSKEG